MRQNGTGRWSASPWCTRIPRSWKSCSERARGVARGAGVRRSRLRNAQIGTSQWAILGESKTLLGVVAALSNYQEGNVQRGNSPHGLTWWRQSLWRGFAKGIGSKESVHGSAHNQPCPPSPTGNAYDEEDSEREFKAPLQFSLSSSRRSKRGACDDTWSTTSSISSSTSHLLASRASSSSTAPVAFRPRHSKPWMAAAPAAADPTDARSINKSAKSTRSLLFDGRKSV